MLESRAVQRSMGWWKNFWGGNAAQEAEQPPSFVPISDDALGDLDRMTEEDDGAANTASTLSDGAANDAPFHATEIEPDGSELREAARVPVELQVRLRFASTDEAIKSRMFDISSGGAFIRMRDPRPLGTPVRMVVSVAERTLVFAGEVVRCAQDDSPNGSPGVGVRFTTITPEDLAFLEQVVRARQRQTIAGGASRHTLAS